MSGVGRGRGWLNLKSSPQSNPAHPHRPGTAVSPTECNSRNCADPVGRHPSINHAVPSVMTSEIEQLSKRITQIDVNDDGILFNQKIKYIFELFDEKCQTVEQCRKVFEDLYKVCVYNEELMPKFIHLMAAPSIKMMNKGSDQWFPKQIFLQQLQNDFEDALQSEHRDARYFRNLVSMLGEFISKAKALRLSPMAGALARGLELLLDSADVADIKVFALQINLLGTVISRDLINSLLIQVRTLLKNRNNLSESCRLWLLFSLDSFASSGKFSPELLSYYAEQLGNEEIATLQHSFQHNNMRAVEKLEDKPIPVSDGLPYKHPDVTLRRVVPNNEVPEPVKDESFPDHTLTNIGDWRDSSAQERPSPAPLQSHAPHGMPYQSPPPPPGERWNVTQDDLLPSPGVPLQPERVSVPVPEKAGRPILGAGARTANSVVVNSVNDRLKNIKVLGQTKPPNRRPAGSRTGWEHDDRFYTDYA